MKIVDGSLRWIITPGKGKVYFLSPLQSEHGPVFALGDRPAYVKAGEDLVHQLFFRGRWAECAVSRDCKGRFRVYFDGKAAARPARKIMGPRMSVRGDVGIFVFGRRWRFYLNGRRLFEQAGTVKSWQFGPNGEVAYMAERNGVRQIFVGTRRVRLPDGVGNVFSCVMDRRGRLAVQAERGGRGVVLLGNRAASLENAEEIGAWQFAPEGRLVMAQKLGGRWGVYAGGKRISPECAMVWGWEYTPDGHFIVPVEFRKGENIVLLKDGKKVYGGKGKLLTWYYHDGKLWVLAIEDGSHMLYCNGRRRGRLAVRGRILKKWQVTASGKVAFEYAKGRGVAGETPRSCHPLDDSIASNEWWFGKRSGAALQSARSVIIAGRKKYSGEIVFWKLLESGEVFFVERNGGRAGCFLDGRKTGKCVWQVHGHD